MPKVPEKYTQIRKEEILATTWKCFAEKGYQGTTVRVIAEKMGLSTGVIYHYYKSKDDILNDLMEWVEKHQGKLIESVEEKEDPLEMLGDLFATLLANVGNADLQISSTANLHLWVESLKHEQIRALVNRQFNDTRNRISSFWGDSLKTAGIDPNHMASFYMAVITGIQVQSALIDDFEIEPFYVDLMKILFGKINSPGNSN